MHTSKSLLQDPLRFSDNFPGVAASRRQSDLLNHQSGCQIEIQTKPCMICTESGWSINARGFTVVSPWTPWTPCIGAQLEFEGVRMCST